ncbi:hypothetical protein PTTG_08994 [Puccinia triticina 1-1 BBBD Race 1]|uniref:Uncharacterized protein n=1 Tax=Puccinia triticina (isolate 1-1 / race 1 (BBBD)) TaxID=630390 RepID=A0A0C4F766_PUCT1|nr:hypothetical protein PTTG_08994 [Puccinia triticina 1-1 BBBD Race 1]
MDYLNYSTSEDKSQASTKMKITCQSNKARGHLEHHKNLMNDYFNEDSCYGPQDFSRHYRMEKGLLLRILTDLTAQYRYFFQKPVGPFFTF